MSNSERVRSARVFLALFAAILTLAATAGAQVINGRLVDASDSSAVAYAAVSLPDGRSGTVTNELGEFALDGSGADSLLVYHLNYGVTAHPLAGRASPYVIALPPLAIDLDEVVVSATPPGDLLYEAIRRSEAALALPTYLNTYYRELVEVSGEVATYADGLVNYLVERKGKSKLKTEVWVEDSRSVQLTDDEEWSDVSSSLKIARAPEAMAPRLMGYFLDEGERDKYDFERRGGSAGQTIVRAIPKPEVEDYLFGGQVVIDEASGLIREVTLSLSPDHVQYVPKLNLLLIKFEYIAAAKRSYFDIGPAGYRLAYNLTEETYRIWNNKSLDETIHSTRDILVTRARPYDTGMEAGEPYKKSALYKRDAPPTTEFWRGARAMQLTPEQARVVKSLEERVVREGAAVD